MATIKRTETSNVTWKEVLEIINSGKDVYKRQIQTRWLWRLTAQKIMCVL